MSYTAGRRMKNADGKMLEIGDPVPAATEWPERIRQEKLNAGIIIKATEKKEEEAAPPKAAKKKTKKKI
tara:strand:- start:3742 stop:3948 length:207 start_codon:yes stop_codon:yes gene_type:complete